MNRILINENWQFSQPGKPEITLSLPHTWNSQDGQDGGNDYFRGECRYRRTISPEFKENQRVYLECEGANSVATVLVNQREMGTHRGGYSTFRIDLTDSLESGKQADLELRVDNSHRDDVYPQMADFTFFGGLYRDTYLIIAEETRFSLDDHGSQGVYIRQRKVTEERADIEVEALVDGDKPCRIIVRITDGDGRLVATAQTGVEGRTNRMELSIENPRLWQGVTSPYLYRTDVLLICDGSLIDSRSIPLGLRYFSFDSQNGLILNGHPLPLRGVSRHQDRADKGWAISREDMEEDMNLINDMGANSIRLAHYQHNRYFYDLCDRYGMVAWAEIPYISLSSPTDFTGANAKEQMTELIKQNYNHPSILIWGVQNEITIAGKENNLESIVTELNALVRELDSSRATAQAQVGHLPTDDSLNGITDLVGYNNYLGWYYGESADMGPWVDEFHRNHPDIALGITEYGCEAVLSYHNDNPRRSDYSEEYQTRYHHEMVRTWNSRPWIWGTYVWNMFDFASDMRHEGGVKGMNNKGLVTHDRSLKKDSYFVYQSFWSQKPVLRIASRRYVNRPKGKTKVEIITNLPRVELFLDGVSLGIADVEDNWAIYDKVKLRKGEHSLVVRAPLPLGVKETGVDLPSSAADIFDSCVIRGVSKADPSYTAPPSKGLMDGVTNWFEEDEGEAAPLEFPQGRLSIKDKIGDILKYPEGEEVLHRYMEPLFDHPMFPMVKNFSIEKMVSMKPENFPSSLISRINGDLIRIEK